MHLLVASVASQHLLLPWAAIAKAKEYHVQRRRRVRSAWSSLGAVLHTIFPSRHPFSVEFDFVPGLAHFPTGTRTHLSEGSHGTYRPAGVPKLGMQSMPPGHVLRRQSELIRFASYGTHRSRKQPFQMAAPIYDVAWCTQWMSAIVIHLN